MGIRGKIVLPFLALFATALSLAVWVAAEAVTGAVEERLLRQTQDLARVVANTSLRGPVLAKVGEAFGAEVVLTDAAGTYVEGTLDRAAWERLGPPAVPDGAVVRAGADAQAGGPGEFVVTRAPFRFALEPAAYRFHLLFPAARIRDQKLRAARPLVTVALAGLAGVALVGYAIARRIARPLVELSEQTQAISRGAEVRLRVPVTGDEIQRLAESFEHLLASLARHEEEARRADRVNSLGKLAAGIAHEIKNPLTSMKLTLQLLERGETEPERSKGFGLVLQEVERLRLLVEEMLDMGRPAALDRAPADWNAIVRDSLALVARQAEHRGVTVTAEWGTVPTLKLDATRMKQAVLNLLLNAMEAMPRGGPLAVRTTPLAGGARLEVRDRGEGVAAVARERLFEPFFTTRPGGVGLGLPITRRVVEDHGGRIGFEDVPGGGTCFWLEVPTEIPSQARARNRKGTTAFTE
ncbi:MAG: HAMP domain-containing protein [Planctomycetes bacterium]|nr:HAMP domain-containing protein [Planctomycetota bacterium]